MTPTPDKLAIPEAAVEALARDLAIDANNAGGDTAGVKKSMADAYWPDYAERARCLLSVALHHMPGHGYAEVGPFTNCCVCGRVVDTREMKDGGDPFGSQMSDGRWTCSGECWDQLVDPAPPALADNAELHPDDEAVDRFAAAMKAKLAQKRIEGRGGWEDKDQCSVEFLSDLLRKHVSKGDPLDVGNFAMMLHQRGELIASPSLIEGVAELSETQRLAGFIREAQAILAEYIVPDSGISDRDCVNQLLGVLDRRDVVLAARRVRPSPVDQDARSAVLEEAAIISQKEKEKLTKGFDDYDRGYLVGYRNACNNIAAAIRALKTEEI